MVLNVVDDIGVMGESASRRESVAAILERLEVPVSKLSAPLYDYLPYLDNQVGGLP